MAGDLYWISTLTYAVVLLIILVNDCIINRKPNKEEKTFRRMTSWIVFFCFQDMIWGLCENGTILGDRCFFVSSTVFHMSTVLTTFFWLYYVLVYIGENKLRYRIYMIADIVIILFELVLVVVNFFRVTLFTIEDGRYITGTLRSLTFINQYVVYLLIGVLALVMVVRTKRANNAKHDRYWTVFVASLAPILLGIFQLLFPDAPFYSLGYFLGCFLMYVLIISKDRQEAERATVFSAIAKNYYSMHMIDLEKRHVEHFIEPAMIRNLIGNSKDPQEMLLRVVSGTTNDEYSEIMTEFVDLSTISDRLRERNQVSCEFIGRNYGWTRMSITSLEKKDDIQRKIMIITQVIDAEKRQEIELLFKSYNDALTGLYNRSAYETAIAELDAAPIADDFVLVSMDVNGLKVVNDTLGHAAGDELICGAADCMKRCFSSYGKIYRTGGDEFVALIYANEAQLETIRRDFEDITLHWEGELIDKLSVSTGYLPKSELLNPTFREMSILADERMYDAKKAFYAQKGVDRRGQKDAHIALCALYTKILKININEDSFEVVDMDHEEMVSSKGYSTRLSEWFTNFANSGYVHPEDREMFLEETSLPTISQYFAQGKNTTLGIVYRRKYGDEFKKVLMEIIPAGDYTNENQNLFLYVKKIDR